MNSNQPPSCLLSPQARNFTLQAGVNFTHLSGHEAVLGRIPLLMELADRAGLMGCLDHLRFFHSSPYFGNKVPHLLLLNGPSGPLAAVLMYEYRVAGLPLRMFIPADAGGERSVIAPLEERASVACQAARFLLQRGALMVMLSFACSDSEDFASTVAVHRAVLRALRTRTLRRDLPVAASLDQTLAQMGAHTRRNLRAYRRRGEAAGLRYVSDARVPADEFLKLNQECSYPVPERVALWRLWSTSAYKDSFTVGLQEVSGRWACLAGGRRYRDSEGAVTAIDWQMNRTDLARLSLGTTLRSYLLEEEVNAGTRRLRFEGGTPHSMCSSFVPETVADFIFAQPWLRGSMARAFGRKLRAGNLLGETLLAKDLRWL